MSNVWDDLDILDQRTEELEAAVRVMAMGASEPGEEMTANALSHVAECLKKIRDTIGDGMKNATKARQQLA